LYIRKEGEGPERVARTQDIPEPETGGTTVSPLGSRFDRFMDLGAADTASVLSRALPSCLIKETRPRFSRKVGQSGDGSGDRELKRDGERIEDCMSREGVGWAASEGGRVK
jgi:hypothetical protein